MNAPRPAEDSLPRVSLAAGRAAYGLINPITSNGNRGNLRATGGLVKTHAEFQRLTPPFFEILQLENREVKRCGETRLLKDRIVMLNASGPSSFFL